MRTRFETVAPWFFVSGAVALGCEAAWLRALGLLFGASLSATGALLAAFMVGIALGSELAARLAGRLRRPVRAYALAEATVGLWALVVPLLFARVSTLAAGVGPLGRLGLAFVLLCPPTVAMGATLPLLTAAIVDHRAELQRGVARLYTVNLLGAAAGALVTGFVLLPRLGLSSSSRVLGMTALAVAVLAARSSEPVAVPASTPSIRHSLPDTPGEPLAVVVTAIVGALSFALQVGWNRALAVLIGSSAYTFASVAAAVLLGTALGGAWAARADATDTSWAAIARRCFALGVTTWLSTLVIHVAPRFLKWSVTTGGHAGWMAATVATVVVMPPAFQIGAMFPVLAARYPDAEVGKASGRAVLAATVGNVVGALAAAFVCVPRWGLQATLDGVALAAVVLACVTAARSGLQHFRYTVMAAALGCMFAHATQPTWDRVSISAGTFRAALYRERTFAHGTACDASRPLTRRRKVLYYREGAVGTVLVLGFPLGPTCSLYSMRIDGKAEGSVFVAAPLAASLAADAPVLPVGDLPTEVLAGWLPAMAGDVPSDALVVGWGTGISARSLLDAGARSVTAVELEPAVLDAARIFDAAALVDPRVRLVTDDARVVLRRAHEGSYDVIASHPSNPWVVGAASLFSHEYFALARSRLREGGRMLAWVQLYETDREAVRSLVATFVEVFPDTQVFQPSADARDLLLLGTRDAVPRSREALRGVIAGRMDARAATSLARAGLADVDALMARRLAGGEHLAAWSRGATINTEGNAWLEYRVADHLRATVSTPVGVIVRGLVEER